MGESYSCLLRLLCAPFFSPSLYSTSQCLARGAYGSVYTCQPAQADTSPSSPTSPLSPPPHGEEELAVKLVQVKVDRFYKSNVREVLAEVLALRELQEEGRVSRLFDFGTDGASFWLVMRRYHGTLKEWVRSDVRSMSELLAVYAQSLAIVQMLQSHRVSRALPA